MYKTVLPAIKLCYNSIFTFKANIQGDTMAQKFDCIKDPSSWFQFSFHGKLRRSINLFSSILLIWLFEQNSYIFRYRHKHFFHQYTMILPSGNLQKVIIKINCQKLLGIKWPVISREGFWWILTWLSPVLTSPSGSRKHRLGITT